MDRIVDLDAVKEELDCRRSSWRGAGLVVGDVTWRDDSVGAAVPLVTDRRAAPDPQSLGVTLTGAGDRYARVVVWRGGWADVDGFDGTEIFVETPTFSDVPGCLAAVDAVALRVTRR